MSDKQNLLTEIVGWVKFGLVCAGMLVIGTALLALIVLSALAELGFRWGLFA